MKIGIFDSGLGGLFVARAVKELLPAYDYVYFGDTKNLPYGDKSHEAVYKFTKKGIEYLFEKESCVLVVVACNTASARALRRIQQDKSFKNKKVIGVLIPAAEEGAKWGRVGVLATVGTVASGTFSKEIKKINPKCQVWEKAAPMLVPLIEQGEIKNTVSFLQGYLKPLLAKNINALVLGCTHYPILKKEIKRLAPKKVKIISQDEIVPMKLKSYLSRHSEIAKKLKKNKSTKILVTKMTPNVNRLTREWFGSKIKPKLVKL
jgi:glutamate racemase